MGDRVLLVAIVLSLAACAQGGPPRLPAAQVDRALAGAPGAAQPSRIVATELAFARAAREDGQWTAFRAFAAPGALLHGRSGAFEAIPWFMTQADPAEAVTWAPTAVWMSCDAQLAISVGRARYPDGMVGSYVTAWELQDRDTYRWVYDSGAMDNPQPPARAPVDAQPGDIVVEAMEAVEGNVADCARRGEAKPPVPADATRLSPDGTLAYRWEHRGQGERAFTAWWLHEGTWQVAYEHVWPAS